VSDEHGTTSPSMGVSGPTASCVTCGVELHPERAEKYDYCSREECRAENARGLTIVAVGVNKAADQYVVLDERAEQEMASGRYRDPGRTASGRLGPGRSREGGTTVAGAGSDRVPHRSDPSDEPVETWTREEQNLALAYEITGRLPIEEIARRLGRSQRAVAAMLVAAKARWGSRTSA
jgi:hypothetical protein